MQSEKQIPFLCLKPSPEQMGKIESAVLTVMKSGQYINGAYKLAFERDFSGYLGAQFCCGVANGLDALTLALSAAGIGEGDEVIVPAFTFIATWFAINRLGAKIVPVDVDIDTANIDARLVENKITSRTKAIVAVHLYGHPADMDALWDLAQLHELVLIEDAAQAHGAKYKGRKVGTLGHAAAFSFYPGKNLGAYGDAGCVITSDELLFNRVKMESNYGSSQKYVHQYIGVNSRLDELQAKLLSIKLSELDLNNAIRKRQALIYDEHIRGNGIVKPVEKDYANSVWHLYAIRVSDRDRLKSELAKNGIETLIHYPMAPFSQECYRHMKIKERDFQVSYEIANTTLSLPIGPHLMDEDIIHVANVLSSLT